MDQDQIRTRIETIVESVRARLPEDPDAARYAGETVVRKDVGLTCTVAEGDWVLRADLPESKAGEGSAPDPGFFGRAALGVCAVQTYTIYFARRGVPLDGLEVAVSMAADASGLLGLGPTVSPGYEAVHCRVTVRSPADRETVLAVLDEADRRSPWRDNFTRALPVTREVVFEDTAASGEAAPV